MPVSFKADLNDAGEIANSKKEWHIYIARLVSVDCDHVDSIFPSPRNIPVHASGLQP
jgi:hypothetical protein